MKNKHIVFVLLMFLALAMIGRRCPANKGAAFEAVLIDHKADEIGKISIQSPVSGELILTLGDQGWLMLHEDQAVAVHDSVVSPLLAHFTRMVSMEVSDGSKSDSLGISPGLAYVVELFDSDHRSIEKCWIGQTVLEKTGSATWIKLFRQHQLYLVHGDLRALLTIRPDRYKDRLSFQIKDPISGIRMRHNVDSTAEFSILYDKTHSVWKKQSGTVSDTLSTETVNLWLQKIMRWEGAASFEHYEPHFQGIKPIFTILITYDTLDAPQQIECYQINAHSGVEESKAPPLPFPYWLVRHTTQPGKYFLLTHQPVLRL